ncbi:MAG: DUF2130 domain-containing protein, partial [Muribaculaceae bacterium]|nr:DUF2130 domain-containing protein [Muribaculaceae bacterium]
MKELKCPNCQHVFQVDDAMFESLANQVRNAAFDEEVNRRLAEMSHRLSLEQQAKAKQLENDFARQLNEKDVALAKRDSQLAIAKERLDCVA